MKLISVRLSKPRSHKSYKCVIVPTAGDQVARPPDYSAKSVFCATVNKEVSHGVLLTSEGTSRCLATPTSGYLMTTPPSESSRSISSPTINGLVMHGFWSALSPSLGNTSRVSSRLLSIIEGSGRTGNVQLSANTVKYLGDYASSITLKHRIRNIYSYEIFNYLSNSSNSIALPLFSPNVFYSESSSNVSSSFCNKIVEYYNTLLSTNHAFLVPFSTSPEVYINPTFQGNIRQSSIVITYPNTTPFMMNPIFDTSIVFSCEGSSNICLYPIITNLFMFTIIEKCDSAPVFIAGLPTSETLSVISPRFVSSSAMFGKFDLKKEYINFYEFLLETDPIMLIGAIMAATDKVIALKYAIARYIAMGYTRVVPYTNVNLSMYHPSGPSASLLNVLNIEVSKNIKEYSVVFRSPPVIINNRIIIDRSIPSNIELMIIKGTTRDVIYYNLVLFYHWSASMFTNYVINIDRVIESAINTAVSTLGSSLEYAGLINSLVSASTRSSTIELKVKFRKIFNKVISENKVVRSVILKTGSRAFNLEELLNTAINYSYAVYRSFAVAALSMITFSLASKRWMETCGRYVGEAFKILGDYFKESSRESVLNKVALGEAVSLSALHSRIVIKNPELLTRVSITPIQLASIAGFNAVSSSGPVDPTPVGFLKLATNVLNNFCSLAMGMNLAYYDVVSLLEGSSPNLYNELIRWCSLLWGVAPLSENQSIFTLILRRAVPKDVLEYFDSIRMSYIYVDFFNALLRPFMIASVIAPLMPKIAELTVIAMKAVDKYMRWREETFGSGRLPSLMESTNAALPALAALGALRSMAFAIMAGLRKKAEEISAREFSIARRAKESPCCPSLPPDYSELESLWAWKGKFIISRKK